MTIRFAIPTATAQRPAGRLAWIAALLAALALLAGCASTAQQQGKDLSSAGIAYAQATTAVLDAALDAAIDADNEGRLRTIVPATTPEQRVQRTQRLAEFDAELVRHTQQVLGLKRSVSALQAYFTGLQALAGANPGEATEAAVSSLAERLNGISSATGGSELVTADQQTAAAGFAKALVRQAHGAAVARALERDAERIGRALVLQELTLRVLGQQLRGHLQVANAHFYRERVLDPFLSGQPGAGWAQDRRTYIVAKAVGTSAQVLSAADEAAAQMQSVWKRVLAGEPPPADFARVLKDLDELVDALTAVKKAF